MHMVIPLCIFIVCIVIFFINVNLKFEKVYGTNLKTFGVFRIKIQTLNGKKILDFLSLNNKSDFVSESNIYAYKIHA